MGVLDGMGKRADEAIEEMRAKNQAKADEAEKKAEEEAND